MAYNTVAHGICEIKPFAVIGKEVDDAERIDLMLELAEPTLLGHLRYYPLSDMSERSMPEIMPHSDGPCKL